MTEKIKIVVVGTGFGGTYTVKSLYKFLGRDNNIEISMVGPKNYFLFTPLLHEVATGGISSLNIIEPIRKVLGKKISNFYLGKVEKINLNNKTIQVSGNIIPYDYLVLAPGSETNFYDIEGAEENSLSLKSLEDAVRIKGKVVCQTERASHIQDRELRKNMLTFTIVGGGPTGVELAAELQELIKENFPRYFKQEVLDDASVVLIQRGSEILNQFNPKFRKKSLEVLTKKGIKVLLNSEVKTVSSDRLVLSNGEQINTETIVWVAGVKPIKIDFDVEVEKIKDGRIVVNEFLQMKMSKDVFILGDGAAFENEKDCFLPALAQVAEKEAEYVAKSIYLILKNKKLTPFRYKHRGSMLSLGQWMAIGEVSGFTFSGRLTWWLWRTLYLSKLISIRKKINVATDWTINLFSPRDISEV